LQQKVQEQFLATIKKKRRAFAGFTWSRKTEGEGRGNIVAV
jgi:hypothetical protein